MNNDRRSVLQMLSDGKITADEAERLLGAMEGAGVAHRQSEGVATGHNKPPPKYLRVSVDATDPGEGPTKVNIRVPMALLRAGVRLTSLIPPAARDQVNEQLAKNGMPFDIGQLKPENLEDLIAHLDELTVDVDAQDAKVRIYCE
jgi:hypothetical protein